MSALLGPIRYAASNATVRARLSRMLPASMWERLLKAPAFEDTVTLIGTTAYGADLNVGIGEITTPEQVERGLQTYLVQAFRAPLKLMQGKPRALFDWLWRRYELENLKIVIRVVAGKLPARRIRETLMIPQGSSSALPWDVLIEAQTVRALLPSLRTTYHGEYYARALEPALGRYEREDALFVLEVALDLAYYRRLLRILSGLSGQDRREGERFVESLVNEYNLLWAFRYRAYLDLSPEEIMNYTLQRRLRVDGVVVRQIALGMPLMEATRVVWGEHLPDLERLEGLPPAEALPKLELLLHRARYERAQRALEGYPFHLGTLLAYTVLLESEVHDLTAIVEGKAAGLPPGQIRPMLIGAHG